MKGKILYKLIFLLTILLHMQVCFAQFEEGKLEVTSVKRIGAAIVPNEILTTTYSSVPGEITSLTKIKNILNLHINEDISVFLPANFSVTVYFTVTSTSITTPISCSLTVVYDKTAGAKYNTRSYKLLPNPDAFVTATITSVVPNPSTIGSFIPTNVVVFENEMSVTRYFNLGSTQANINPSPINYGDAIGVSWTWPANTNNNMSQLEWAWVEDEMAGFYNDGNGLFSTDKLFSDNATRVDLDFVQNAYKIPLLYDGIGKLYYRVRPTLRKNNGSVFAGSWSTAQNFAFNGHDSTLNWQSSTSYAENGKSKTVIQYFDGSLRSRQTVTKDNTRDNTTGNIVVAETIYDLQGRPNVQILPTPTLDNTIQYFKNFNRFQNMALNDDPAKYFDLTPSTGNVCAGSPILDTTQGNGRYYSANNPWLNTEANAKYIPDAYGYDYTETRFMDDATERVRSQGGVGLTHQIGSGHETKYYYGKPNQAELDALFATEVGDASHYSKNMVQDANGQLSVSYTDMHGRTIATAMAGAAPGTLNDISANTTDYPQPIAQITNQLLNPLTNIINDKTIENVSTILAATNTAYTFTYQLDPAILSQLGNTGQQICFDCKYDLEISIKSEDCGATEITRKFNNLQIQSAGAACNTSMGFSGINFDGSTLNNVKQIGFTQTLSPGSWIIRKTLTINDSLYQIRRDSALKVFLWRTQQNIYDSIYNVLYTTSGCGLPPNNTSACDSCNSHLGNFSNYRISYLTSIGIDSGNHTYDTNIQTQYSLDSLACASACNTILNVELTTLKNLRRQMLADMVPFTGQYAIPKDSMVNVPGGSIDYNRMEAKYNIFSNQYQSITRIPFFHFPKTELGAASYYYTSDNKVDSLVHGHDLSGNIILDTITQYPFANLFTLPWANSLIYYHPEFSKLQYAEQNLVSSYNWLDKVQAVDTYASAVAKGYVDPLNLSGTNAANADPFFQITANASDKTVMNNRLTVSIDGAASANGKPSIWQLANSSVMCASANNQNVVLCSGYKTQLDPSITVDSLKDKVWTQYKSLYFSYRNELVLNYIDANATNALNTADKNALIANKKQIIFANQKNIAVQNGLSETIWTNLNSNPPDTTGIGNAGSGSIYNTDKCVAMRPFWMARLKQCEQLQVLLNNELLNDSVRVNNIINKILDGMVYVCHNSLNSQQPNGASNVTPGYTGTPQNFEVVINQVFADSGIVVAPGTNFFCNPYTIDYPKPYALSTPLYTNTTNTIDSCGCERFAALKLEAGADSVNLASMNTFLLANYNDTLSLPLWTGLQNCSNAFRDTCLPKYDTASYTGTYSMTIEGNTPEISGPNASCPLPQITGVTVVTGNMTVNYTSPPVYTSCTLYVTDVNNSILFTQTLNCNSTQTTISNKGINPCTIYKLYIISTASSGSCTYATSVTYQYNGCGDPCPARPVIYKLSLILPTPTNGTQNVSIWHTIAAGGTNCLLKALALNANGSYTTVLTQAITCANGITQLNLPACLKYRFVVQSDYTGSGSCGIQYSDTARLDSCWHTVCTKIFTPIILPTVVTVPSFLNCGYTKPCITCGKLDTLTMAFRALYSYCSGVPFTDSTATDDQLKQNALWARYLNYKTGFSNTYYDYVQAYNSCHANNNVPPSTTALCRFTKPANNPDGIFVTDSFPCKIIQNQAIYLSQIVYQLQKDSLMNNFDSLYRAECLSAKYTEQFFVTYQPKEYHYTLYYYDQAGNLVKTTPPAAVKPNYNSSYLAAVASARAAGTDYANNNNEQIATQYRYNTLNQVIIQKTPDANISKFWYDRLGRLVVSQNAKQQPLNNYSYTLYDYLGRIAEVGQLTQSTAITQTISRNEADANTVGSLANWLNNKPAEQITRTFYDQSYLDGQSTLCFEYLCQKNLRNRVSYAGVYASGTPGSVGSHTNATFYSYDIHGNVDTLLQDYNVGTMNDAANRFKKLVYNYDLISGKVNSVAYQPNQPDAFYHRYNYDAENRLTSAETSKDSIIWETDARYTYYRHGPLSRTVLGQLGVQGLDYAYTLQGWLKGVNSTAVGDGSFDMGNDGVVSGSNGTIARDAYGYSLNYFNSDYKPIGQSVSGFKQPFINNTFDLTNSDPSLVARQLYNGNIAAMVTAIPKFNQINPVVPVANVYGYKYDQLNRISSMDVFTGIDNNTNVFTASASQNYKERIAYDPNGNIKTYLRNGTALGGVTPQTMDNLTYQYEKDATGNILSNKLRYVHDQVADANYTEDINNQTTLTLTQVQNERSAAAGSDNYQYDAIGNLIKDTKENINNIIWTVYGKIQSITKTTGTISYTYDASGNRISKLANGIETWYVRDASGNVMSVYTKDAAINTGDLTQAEIHLYGSSRLGVLNTTTNVQNVVANTTGIYTFIRGNKFFELSNHLGNVLVTISDKKIGHDAGNGIIDYYTADVVTANDYYPGGMIMTGRKYSAGSGYRYGFNGKEQDKETSSTSTYDYGFRIYNPALGRFLSVDPLTKNFSMLTPYQYASNTPIWAIDLDGLEGVPSNLRPILVFSHLERVSNESLILKLQHPTWGNLRLFTKASWNVTTGYAHDVLDVAGLLPGAGEPADFINGVLYTLEGDKTNAALSYAGMLPIAGWAATGGKWAKSSLRLSDNAFHSASGLIFRVGSQHGNRLAHVLEHTANDLSKFKHGVFDVGNKLVETLDDAYSKVANTKWTKQLKAGESETVGGITKTLQETTLGDGTKELRESFVIDMGKKVGYEGGKNGTGEALNKINLVVKQGTSDVITAFPTR